MYNFGAGLVSRGHSTQVLGNKVNSMETSIKQAKPDSRNLTKH